MQPGSSTEPLRTRLNRRAQSFWGPAIVHAVGAVLLLAIISVATASLPPPNPAGNDLKAAYLLDFGRFVRWSKPVKARSSFQICTLGRDSMGSSLERLAVNARIDSLPVRVDQLQDISAAKSCAIVFMSATESNHVRENLAFLGNADILTVSDAPGFLQHGGMIQFVIVSSHVRFAVDLDAVNRTHLVLSSELLRVASSVSGKPPRGDLK